jgi:serine/threonine protein kinase
VTPRRATAVRSGDRFGDWRVERRLGRGGFGEVWLGRHELSGQPAAVKFPRRRDVLEALRREGGLVGKLAHPLVVETLGANLDGKPPWIAFRYVEGESLREKIRRGTLGVDVALGIYGDVLAALGHAHGEGVIHGDLKPENILVDAEGRAHLTDFGLGIAVGQIVSSVAVAGTSRTEDGLSVSGSLEYMAPEQRRGEGAAVGSDLYAAALILFEMLTGALPEGAESPSDLRPGLDPRVDDLFHRGHARPERRCRSTAEALEHLDAVLRARDEGERTCAECGAVAQAGEHYCDRCGSRLRADAGRCACGFLPEVGDRYCIRCGRETDAGRLV